MSKPKITLFVDIVSPFAYLAFYALHNFPVFKQCEITYVPVFLAGIMKACGNTPPLKIKNKDKWISTERLRWSTALNIPISQSPPPGFPTNTIHIQRVLTALSLSHPSALPSALALFWQSYWVHWNDTSTEGNMLAIVITVVGSEEEARKVLEASHGAEVKKRLGEDTEMAVREGAFGLPWFVGEATNSKGETERYWGVDHLGQLCDHLGLERPGGRGWKALL
ncbi:thioredoxin-like protein [Karstenula rhodostoma CBS 690.94]|uniref:Glutathione S-transferase kappa n=1 Tax=Karstenula rhodostoma CBS 690.94 TaxID=1392251 RepID=A0A9P4U9J3_9PLEO|nr:thioredoxin-like protein [Karstenula rhodostoma CBS 690.94]